MGPINCAPNPTADIVPYGAFDFIIRANGIRIHALDIINRTHEIIISFHDIIFERTI